MPTFVALLSVELHLPDALSLKDKRMTLRSVKDRLRKLNVSVAEVGHHDVWQRAAIGVVTVGNARAHVDQVLAAALEEIEQTIPGHVTSVFTEMLT